MKNKNLIIGAATGYQKKELYFFIESLRKVYFDKVILIVNKNITEETRNYLNSNKIDIFFTKYKSKTIFKDRYSLYSEIIKNQLNIENIMLTDTADVIFFDDPFNNKLFSEINFFLEDKTIAECETNTRWIKRLYGNNVLNKINKNRISCSGITLGNRENILYYCNLMVNEIKNFKYRSINPFSTGKGSDQGNHNKLIHSSGYNTGKKFYNEDCFVVNVSNSDPKIVEYRDNNFYINRRKISVLHQYNSHEMIFKDVRNFIQKIS